MAAAMPRFAHLPLAVTVDAIERGASMWQEWQQLLFDLWGSPIYPHDQHQLPHGHQPGTIAAMEGESIVAPGRELDVAGYYESAKNLEVIRNLLAQMRDAIPVRKRNNALLAACLNTHQHDDTLAFLAVANDLDARDRIAPEVWPLIRRHHCTDVLQGLLNSVFGIADTDVALREQLRLLIVDRAKRLLYSEESAHTRRSVSRVPGDSDP